MNVSKYNEEMAKSLEDKLFFLKKIPDTPFNYVDVGCGDGSLLIAIRNSFRAKGFYFGVENCVEQEQLASARSVSTQPTVEDIAKHKFINFKPVVAILSSVLHESPTLLNQVLDHLKPEYICIRDMALSEVHLNYAPYLEAILKSRYKHNPSFKEREFNESYFSLTAETFFTPPPNYETIYYRHEIYGGLAKCLKQEVNFDLRIPTHLKVIYRRLK